MNAVHSAHGSDILRGQWQWRRQGAKSGTFAVPAEHFEDGVYSCMKYVAQTDGTASLESEREKPPE